MVAGALYRPDDPELQAEALANQGWLARYNGALGRPPEDLRRLLLERLAFVGAGAVVRPPFFCDYGFNIRLGAGAFLNFGCVVLDVAPVEIGDGSQIGPAVQIYAADHPRDPRSAGAGSNAAGRCGSGATSGSAAGRSSCRASRSGTTRSSGPGRW